MVARSLVIAAPESVSVVQCSDPFLLARACYHLGNRHVPLQIMPGELHISPRSRPRRHAASVRAGGHIRHAAVLNRKRVHTPAMPTATAIRTLIHTKDPIMRKYLPLLLLAFSLPALATQDMEPTAFRPVFPPADRP